MYKINKLEKIDSTNTYLKENYELFNSFDVVYTDNQLQGIGRRNNTWYSDKDSITMSIILKGDYEKIIKFLPSLIIYDILKYESVDVSIKWPNDILVNGKKICGILTNVSYMGSNVEYIIIGIGLNVNNLIFPKELNDNITSLIKETGKMYDRESIIKNIQNKFFEYLKNYTFNDVYTKYKEVLRELNTDFIYKGKTAKGIKLYPDGKLMISVDDSNILLDATRDSISITTEGYQK